MEATRSRSSSAAALGWTPSGCGTQAGADPARSPSIQSDHLHLIVEAASAADLGRGMKSLGARLAHSVNRVFRRRGAVLADRYHVRALRTPREVRNALAYVLLNARRHAAKLGRRLSKSRGVDPASSGRWFEGWRSPPAQRAVSDPPAVAMARTWLLRIGWRRAGLIDQWEVPGRRGREGAIGRLMDRS